MGGVHAEAATVTGKFGTHVYFDAKPGEVNQLQISVEGSNVIFRDQVPLTPVRRCTSRTPTEVECPGTKVYIDLGDGDDSAHETSGYGIVMLLAGGDGNDSLTGDRASLFGGAGDDKVVGHYAIGGPGNDLLLGVEDELGYPDTLIGGAGADEIHAGPGDDTLEGELDGQPSVPEDLSVAAYGESSAEGDAEAEAEAAVDSDILDGGPGTDETSYLERSTSISVDLARGVVEGQGETDSISEIEYVVAGSGPDQLLGGPGPDELIGAPGDDMISGGAGDDVLRAGSGADHVAGGEGDDWLEAGPEGGVLDGGVGDDYLVGHLRATLIPGEGDDEIEPGTHHYGPLSCGPGNDRVEQSGGRVFLEPDCERMSSHRWYETASYPVFEAPSQLVFRVRIAWSGEPGYPEHGETYNRVSLRLPRERKPFFAAVYETKRRRLKIEVKVPKRILALPDSSIPIRVSINANPFIEPDILEGPPYVRWTFDLRKVASGSA